MKLNTASKREGESEARGYGAVAIVSHPLTETLAARLIPRLNSFIIVT